MSKTVTTTELTWSWGGNSTVHKTDLPYTAVQSAPVATVTGGAWSDGDPDEFPGVTYYLVKP